MTPLQHLPATGYVTLPWKNGLGTTDEICLRPETADRDAFDLRVSRATIAAEAPFSAFPGVERIITVIEGAGLRLDFANHSRLLAPGEPCRFDSGLTPVGIPLGGGIRVLNVMVARSVWQLGEARMQDAAGPIHPDPGGFAVIHALGGWTLASAAATLRLKPGDTAIAAGEVLATPGPGARALVVPVAPA
ncbi:HutD family protein [Tabrizicola sp.]|uniref:HutD/Ves family protein n=1 Tax=Tabrizicola sp. TaxID=2005166 RepID=UPI0035B11010